MPDAPSLRFPVAVLQQEGAYLLRAYAAHRPEMDARLGNTFLPTATAAHEALFGPLPTAADAPPPAAEAAPAGKARSKAAPAPTTVPAPAEAPESTLAQQAHAAAHAASLTREQNDALDELTELMASARRTAKRAFKGQTVRLHDDYQIGEHDSRTLADVIARAGIILAACRRDAAALQAAGGWTPAETDALAEAIQATGGAEVEQVTAQGAAVGATGDKRTQATEYFELLLRLQNAANLQWPARKPASAAPRREFRLGLFPPSIPKKPAAPTPTPTPPNPSSPTPTTP